MYNKKLEDIKWLHQMGVDESIGENTINRLQQQQKLKQEKSDRQKDITAHYSIPTKTELTDTEIIASQCKSLVELKSAVVAFKGLSICKTATNTVFCDGNPESEIMFIGEAPGAEEDAQGIPFCGASGKLLDQMLQFIALRRQKNCYITNTVFWRPPGNRRPTPQEIAICKPFVEKHIALFKPKLLVLVGGTAIASVLDSKQGITKVRGKFFQYHNRFLGDSITTTAIFHPSYLLRSPGQKRLVWHDLLMIEDFLSKNK